MVNKKSALIVGINFSPELTGIGKYTGEMSAWLINNGYKCTVVTSFPYYPDWKTQLPYTGRWYKKETSAGGDQCVYRCPMYVPATPSGLKRIIHEITFCITAFFVIVRLLFKPRHDTVFCMAPPFVIGFLGLFYRFFKGGRLVYHIHDMEIEAARDLNMLRSDALFRLLFKAERFILNSSDFVTTVAQGMKKKIAPKTNKEVIYFPNWADVSSFWPLKDGFKGKSFWGFKEQDKVVLYSGSIGEKQGLETLVDIAFNLRGQKHIKFVICGNGPYKEKLKAMVVAKALQNFFFLPLQNIEVFNNFLNMADVHLVIQKQKACDLMMPSKLITILAVGGLALVTADPGTNLYEIIDEYNMGVLIRPDNMSALQDGIIACCNGDYMQQRANGRIYVDKHLNQKNILEKVLADIGINNLNDSKAVLQQPAMPELTTHI